MEYISLFSSGGVGCYGFKMEGFDCIATSELIERRLNIQKINNKVKYDSGYILGDITSDDTKNELFDAITFYKNKEKITDIDVIIFTPPCQGMSVANHKKNDGTIIKNSLVVESLEIVKKIKPKFFVSENVRSFMNTKCIDNNEEKNIPTNDFEIIDIPNTSDEDNNLNNNQFEQPENNMPVEQINVENIQPSTNIEQINNDNIQPSNTEVEQVPAFDVQQSNLEQPINSYNELNSNPTEPVYSDVQQPIEPIDTREVNTETPISYNEIGDSIVNSSNQQLDNLDNVESVNNYVPVSSSSNNQEENKGKLDKSVKEIITMGIIVALVIILLPVLYNVSTGKYNITNNIKSTVSSLFSKSSNKTTNKKSVNENKSTVIDNSGDEEQTAEDLGLTFDFAKYNNQVLDNVNLNTLLDAYKDYFILLSPTVENGVQIYKIQIAKDVKSAGYSISDPEQAFKEFSAQYLQASANYLITITNDNDNVTTIIATRQ